MRRILFLTLLAVPSAALAQGNTGKRISTLENRVTRVENRVTKLEGGSAQAARQELKKIPANPIGVSFLRKTQVLGEKRAGIRLYIEFKNLSSRRLFAFNGTLVFRDENGELIWTKAYGHSEPLEPGEKVEVSVGLLTTQPKPYLKFVKARAITVMLEKQEVYSAD